MVEPDTPMGLGRKQIQFWQPQQRSLRACPVLCLALPQPPVYPQTTLDTRYIKTRAPLQHSLLVTPFQVAIATIKLRPSFEYDTVPKQAQHAFLRAKVTNTSDYPLLEGKANVYLDQSYVTETSLTSVSPQEEFSCSLGEGRQLFLGVMYMTVCVCVSIQELTSQ